MQTNSNEYAATRVAWDKNDCSIRALACAAGCSYEQASAIYSAAGRILKKGTTLKNTRKVLETWFGMTRLSDVKGDTLAVFIALHPHGRYIVHKDGHAFAVIEGIVHDWDRDIKRQPVIIDAWQVTPITAKKLEALKDLFV